VVGEDQRCHTAVGSLSTCGVPLLFRHVMQAQDQGQIASLDAPFGDAAGACCFSCQRARSTGEPPGRNLWKHVQLVPPPPPVSVRGVLHRLGLDNALVGEAGSARRLTTSFTCVRPPCTRM
jgi:hypothetical protein